MEGSSRDSAWRGGPTFPEPGDGTVQFGSADWAEVSAGVGDDGGHPNGHPASSGCDGQSCTTRSSCVGRTDGGDFCRGGEVGSRKMPGLFEGAVSGESASMAAVGG